MISQRHIISAITSKWRELHIVAEEDLSKLKPFDKTAFPQPSSAATPERCGARQIAPEDVPETLRTLREQDLTVFIDPLDATFQFTQGNVEPVMVLIGVAMDNQPLAGVMYQPFVGEFGKLCWGIAPFGDFKGINSGLTRTEAKVPKSIEEVLLFLSLLSFFLHYFIAVLIVFIFFSSSSFPPLLLLFLRSIVY